MDVVLLANDLMVVSRLQSAASQIGGQLHCAANAGQAIQLCESKNARLLVIDLAMPGLELEVVSQLKGGPASSTRVVAFGPHVHRERLAAAQDAGCDLVLSRGQFFNEIEAILNRVAG